MLSLIISLNPTMRRLLNRKRENLSKDGGDARSRLVILESTKNPTPFNLLPMSILKSSYMYEHVQPLYRSSNSVKSLKISCAKHRTLLRLFLISHSLRK